MDMDQYARAMQKARDYVDAQSAKDADGPWDEELRLVIMTEYLDAYAERKAQLLSQPNREYR